MQKISNAVPTDLIRYTSFEDDEGAKTVGAYYGTNCVYLSSLQLEKYDDRDKTSNIMQISADHYLYGLWKGSFEVLGMINVHETFLTNYFSL